MKLARVEIEHYRAIQKLHLLLHPDLTVLHGANGLGKTSVLSAIATGLGSIPTFLPDMSDIDFRESDRRGLQQPRVRLTAVDGTEWERTADGPPSRQEDADQAQQDAVATVHSEAEATTSRDLPIVAFYGNNRAVFRPPQRRSSKSFPPDFPRDQALQDALSTSIEFRDFFAWFDAKEKEEENEEASCNHRFNDLEAVRTAITSMIPGVSNPRIKESPLRFVVSAQSDDESPQELSIDELSDGYRIMLALAADLARRMAQGNPHLDAPLQSEAVVLIDEIELHLHPSWQQKVLGDLTRTFPNTQFIVSTHSPQVLTTVKRECVVELSREQGGILAASAAAPTYGAEAGYVLENVMCVDPRPGGNEFAEVLERYRKFVADGEGESQEATGLRQQLDALSPEDPALDEADIEIRRRKLFQSMGQS